MQALPSWIGPSRRTEILRDDQLDRQLVRRGVIGRRSGIGGRSAVVGDRENEVGESPLVVVDVGVAPVANVAIKLIRVEGTTPIGVDPDLDDERFVGIERATERTSQLGRPASAWPAGIRRWAVIGSSSDQSP